VRLDDVGGLGAVKEALYTKVIAPLERPSLFSSSLLRQAKGVLLYGPPGTGKTMLAKALAAEAGASFINIRASTLQSKWFGDTNKLVAALWSLAAKLEPCIIFIDEVDALLGARRDQEHEAVTAMKTEFMQLWDGFLTKGSSRVMVLAATNRPWALDDAVLRRFSVQYEVPRPDAGQREKILALVLRRHVREGGGGGVEPGLAAEAGAGGGPALAAIAKRARGFAGSDLLELCCQAAAVPVHEYMAALDDAAYADADGGGSGGGGGGGGRGGQGGKGDASASARRRAPLPAGPRAVGPGDFDHVLMTLRPATEHAEAYRTREFTTGGGFGGGGGPRPTRPPAPSSGGGGGGGGGGAGNGGAPPPPTGVDPLSQMLAALAAQAAAAAGRMGGGSGGVQEESESEEDAA